MLVYECYDYDEDGNPCQGLIRIPHEYHQDQTMYFECNVCGAIGSGPWLAEHAKRYTPALLVEPQGVLLDLARNHPVTKPEL